MTLVKEVANGKMYVVKVPNNGNPSNYTVVHLWGNAQQWGTAQGELLGNTLINFLTSTWSYFEEQIDQVIPYLPVCNSSDPHLQGSKMKLRRWAWTLRLMRPTMPLWSTLTPTSTPSCRLWSLRLAATARRDSGSLQDLLDCCQGAHDRRPDPGRLQHVRGLGRRCGQWGLGWPRHPAASAGLGHGRSLPRLLPDHRLPPGRRAGQRLCQCWHVRLPGRPHRHL
jgi:hypothetical protein